MEVTSQSGRRSRGCSDSRAPGPIWRYTIANRRFVQLVGAALVLTFLVTELSPLQRIFDTVPMTSSQWGICLLCAITYLALVELGKLADRRRVGEREEGALAPTAEVGVA